LAGNRIEGDRDKYVTTYQMLLRGLIQIFISARRLEFCATNMSDNTNASSSGSPAQQAGAVSSSQETQNVIRAILKSQSGEPLSNEKISNLLLANMTTLVQQGKLTQNQIIQVHNRIPVFGIFSDLYLVERVCGYSQRRICFNNSCSS